MALPEGAAAVRAAVLHARARWSGAVLLALGAVQVVLAVLVLVLGDGRWGGLLLSVGAALLGLVSFGVHSDTALALLRDHRWHPDVPPALLRELDAEILLRRQALSALRATPRTAWILTGIALLALAGAVLRTAW